MKMTSFSTSNVPRPQNTFTAQAFTIIKKNKQEKAEILHLSDLTTFMVSPKNCDSISITNFQSH